jgi:hypothetical protein
MGAVELSKPERRSEPRTSIGNEVVLADLCDGRGDLAFCIWDISERGACLMVPPDISVPDVFKILIDENWRNVGVVWRRWSQIGVQFI